MISEAALLEVSYYLLTPVLMVLPWSILFTYGLINGVRTALETPTFTVMGNRDLARLLVAGPGYLLSFLPIHIAAWTYWYRTKAKAWRCLVMAHLVVLFQFVTFAACWRAVFRLMFGRNGWVKTARVAEPRAVDPKVVPA